MLVFSFQENDETPHRNQKLKKLHLSESVADKGLIQRAKSTKTYKINALNTFRFCPYTASTVVEKNENRRGPRVEPWGTTQMQTVGDIPRLIIHTSGVRCL